MCIRDSSNIMKEHTDYSTESSPQMVIPKNVSSPIDFTDCISSVIPLSDKLKKKIKDLIPVLNYKKGEFILKSGEASLKNFGILKGCVRKYYAVDGEEKTTFFYTESQSILANSENNKEESVKYNLVCLEDCQLTVTTESSVQKLFELVPELEKMRFISYQEEMTQYQVMLDTYITSTPEERYLAILDDRPDLLNRVPQYQLASYLGVKPETLSRIRKRIFKKS